MSRHVLTIHLSTNVFVSFRFFFLERQVLFCFGFRARFFPFFFLVLVSFENAEKNQITVQKATLWFHFEVGFQAEPLLRRNKTTKRDVEQIFEF